MTRQQAICLSGLIFLAILCFGRQSALRPFWFDELATWEIAQLPSWDDRVAALRNAADAMPPLYYELVAACLKLPIGEELAARLPAIVGYALAMVGVCWFTTQLGGGWAGVAAASLLLWSKARWFATEARPYGLWVGFAAMVMASWLWTLRGTARWRSLVVWVFLVLSASVHHFSAVMLPLIALATIIHDVSHRKPAWRIWLALAGVIPILVWHYPFLKVFREFYGPTFWTRLTKVTVAELYLAYFANYAVWVVIAAIASIPLLLPHVRPALRRPQPDEIASGTLLASLVALPVLLATAMKLADFTLAARYAFPTLLGACCAIAWLSSSFELLRGPIRIGFAALVLSISAYLVPQEADRGEVVQIHPPPQFPFSVEIQRESHLPVAVGSAMDFLPWLHYSPELRSRLVFPFDPRLAMKYMAHDTIERIFVKLPARDMRLTPNYDAFVYQHQRFYMAARRGYGFWLPDGLKDLGAKLTLLAEDRAWQLFLVTLPQEHTLVQR